MKNETRAVILAAGRGSRMGKHTDNIPKCKTKLQNRSLLDWQLESIEKAGIKQTFVVTGYKREMLKGNFDSVVNINWSETNMVYSLFCLPKQNRDLIISYSDIAYNHNHLTKLIENKNDIVITADLDWFKLWSIRFNNPLDDAESFKVSNSILTEIGQVTNDLNDIDAQYMGLIKLTPNGWDILYKIFQSLPVDKQKSIHMTDLINKALKQNFLISVEYVKGGWCEADTYSDIIIYEKMLSKSEKWSHDWR
jgi:L-glutamine-phosphate cytidylyltransferase